MGYGGGTKKSKGADKGSFDLIGSNILKDALPVKPGAVAPDLACGRGDHSPFMSEIVGDNGLVYAVGLWEDPLSVLQDRIEPQPSVNDTYKLGRER